MQALDSAYEWGMTPLNRNSFSQQQMQGLGSLAPQAGVGLNIAPRPQALSPFANLPTPKFAPNAADYFNFYGPTYKSAVDNLATHGEVGKPLSLTSASSMADNVDPNGAKPYFDPNYPAQSMVALKSWLGPQVRGGADAALRARGLQSTGVGQYAEDKATNYLDQLAPGISPNQAAAIDFERLYGPNITNSLIMGGNRRLGGIGCFEMQSAIPGAAQFGGGGSNAQAMLMENPNYQALPSAPPASGPPPAGAVPGSPEYNDWLRQQFPGLNLPPPGGGIGLTSVGATTPQQDPSQPTMDYQAALAASQQPYQPQFGVFDAALRQGFLTPGYMYDPQRMPDASRMPWLANATSPTSPTAP